MSEVIPFGHAHGFNGDGYTHADRPCDTEQAIYKEWPPEEMVEVTHVNPSEASKILADASSLIDGDRHRAHGERHQNFQTISDFWSVLFGIPVPKWKVARAFELAKIARDMNGEPNRDNATDGAGYSALSWELRS